MTEAVKLFRSKVVPILRPNIDTDQIIPARYVTVRTPEEFAYALFRNAIEEDPTFPLNLPEMAGRTVLLAAQNFGCGSSREAAVWALVHSGFRAVIAPTFGDIFYANSLKNALLPIRVSVVDHEALVRAVEADPELEVGVDLPAARLTVESAGIEVPIEIDPFYRDLLVNGMDELDYLLSCVPAAEQWEQGDQVHPSTRRALIGA